MNKKSLLVFSLVCLLSGWTWTLFKINIFITFTCIMTSYFLLEYFITKKISNRKIFLVIFLVIVLFGYCLVTSFDKRIFQSTILEQIQVNERYQYFFKELKYSFVGNRALVYYVSKVKPPLNKYLENTARIFDIDSYFPRRFSLIFVPFAFSGLFYFLKELTRWIFASTLISILVSGLTDVGNVSGPIIFYVLIIFLITLGFVRLFKVEKR